MRPALSVFALILPALVMGCSAASEESDADEGGAAVSAKGACGNVEEATAAYKRDVQKAIDTNASAYRAAAAKYDADLDAALAQYNADIEKAQDDLEAARGSATTADALNALLAAYHTKVGENGPIRAAYNQRTEAAATAYARSTSDANGDYIVATDAATRKYDQAVCR
jgi:hypothetical protein